jgi:hypothetical protein
MARLVDIPASARGTRVVPLSEITNIFSGRDGLAAGRIALDEATEPISGANVRALSAGP